MKRTQIYLTAAQRQHLKEQAEQKEISLSEEIRRIIDFVRHKFGSLAAATTKTEKEENFGSWLSELTILSKKLKEDDQLLAIPQDKATDLDYYLYEEPYA